MQPTASQPPLFVESIYDALRAIVQHLGGPKVIGAALWPAKSVDDARKQLLDCLNDTRNDKLDPEQVVLLFRLAREAGFDVAKHWFDVETGYQLSLPADPLDEQSRQIAIIESAGQQLQRALNTLDKIRERSKPLARVG